MSDHPASSFRCLTRGKVRVYRDVEHQAGAGTAVPAVLNPAHRKIGEGKLVLGVRIISTKNQTTAFTDHGVAVPIATGNNLLHDRGGALHQLVDGAQVGSARLCSQYSCINCEGGRVSALSGVAVEVVLRTLTRGGAADVVHLIADDAHEVAISGVEHAVFDHRVCIAAHRDTKGGTCDATGLVREALLSDQAGNVAVGGRRSQ